MSYEKLFKYARVDFYRAICSRRFIIGVVGVFLCMCLGMCVDGGYNISVLYVFDAVTYGIPFLLVTIFLLFHMQLVYRMMKKMDICIY